MSEAKSSPLAASRKLEEEAENVVEGSSHGHDSVDNQGPAKHDEHESTGDQDAKVDHGALTPGHDHDHDHEQDHHEHGKLRGKSSSDGSKAGGSSVKRPSGGPRNESDSSSSSSEESDDSGSEDSADESGGVKTRPKLRGQAIGGAVKAGDTGGPKGPKGPKDPKDPKANS